MTAPRWQTGDDDAFERWKRQQAATTASRVSDDEADFEAWKARKAEQDRLALEARATARRQTADLIGAPSDVTAAIPKTGPGPLSTEPQEGYLDTIRRGLARGTGSAVGGAGAFLQAHEQGPTLGSRLLRGAGERMQAWGAQVDEATGLPIRFERRGNEVVPVEPAPPDIPHRIVGDVASGLATSAPSLLAGLAGGGLPAMFATSYLQNTGEVLQDVQRRTGRAPTMRETLESDILGVPISALDIVTEAGVVRNLATPAARTLRSAGREMVKSFASEGATEGLQNVIQELGEPTITGDRREPGILGRSLYSGLVGGLSGGIMGGAPEIAGAAINTAAPVSSKLADATSRVIAGAGQKGRSGLARLRDALSPVRQIPTTRGEGPGPETVDSRATAPAAPPPVQPEPSHEREAAIPPGGVEIARLPVADIKTDPKRFQYKGGLDPETGTGGELKAVEKFDETLAGVISVWRDPADGQVYAVNGHHRLELAQRAGHPSVNVQFLNAETAEEARAQGALTNIAEGRGTAVDAANFFRDSGLSADAVKDRISIKGAVMRKGAALAKLAPDVFDQVASGKVSEEHGAAVGAMLDDPVLQRTALRAIEGSSKRLTENEAREVARQVGAAGTEVITQESLFGEEQIAQALWVEKAQLAEAIRRRITADKKLFGYITKGARAEELERGGNVIDVEQSAGIAQESARLEELFRQFYTRSGPVADAITEGARRLARGEKLSTVAGDIFPAISEAVRTTVGGGEAAVPEPPGTAGEVGEPATGTAEPTEELAPPESIRSAATRTSDGRVFQAPVHFLSREAATKAGALDVGAVDGFLTSTGRFVDREDAERIQAQAEGRSERTTEHGFDAADLPLTKRRNTATGEVTYKPPVEPPGQIREPDPRQQSLFEPGVLPPPIDRSGQGGLFDDMGVGQRETAPAPLTPAALEQQKLRNSNEPYRGTDLPRPAEGEYRAGQTETLPGQQNLLDNLSPAEPTEPPSTPPDSEYRYAVADPISALAAIARDRAQRQAIEAEPAHRFSNPATEASIRQAEGIRSLPLSERFKRRMQKVWKRLRTMRHVIPSIDPTADVSHAFAHRLLLQVVHAKQYADWVAADVLESVTRGLTAGQVRDLARVLLVADSQRAVEAGLYDDRPIPFFGRDQDGRYSRDQAVSEIGTEIEATRTAMANDPALQQAYDRRQALVKQITRDLVDRNLLPQEALEDDRYYHRQVLEYAQARDAGERPSSSDARLRKKGFQKRRAGGGEFNTSYVEAEFEWISDAKRQILVKDVQDALRARFDQMPQLRRQAREWNQEAFYQALAAERGVSVEELFESFEQAQESDEIEGPVDPLLAFRRRIAQASSELTSLSGKGAFEDTPFADFGHRLATGEDTGDGFFPFLAYLAKQSEDTSGNLQARGIFSAIRDREQLLQNALGDAYKTWEDLVPEDLRLWQPQRGNIMARGLTLPERILEEVIGGDRELTRDDVQEALIVLGQRPGWVIPTWLADGMDSLVPYQDRGELVGLHRQIIGATKWVYLQAPHRILKYLFNNASGDFDAALLEPRVLKEVPRAARDLFRHHYAHRVEALGMTPLAESEKTELQEWAKRRVLNQGMSVAEIPEIMDFPAFQRLATDNQSGFLRLMAAYPDMARNLTQFRENILRLAAARSFANRIRAGKDVGLAASPPVAVEAATSPEDKAAVLANDLIGDYGAISQAGQTLRSTVFPFWSWAEVNVPRYVRYFRNSVAEGTATGAARGVAAGVAHGMLSLGGKFVKANLFLAAVALYNAMVWPDEDKKLRRELRGRYIITGRNEDGSVRWLRAEGAFADFLDWMAFGDWPEDIRDVVMGTKTTAEQWVETAQAPVNRLVQMWEPYSKTAGEVLMRRSLYPNAFDPRPIRDVKQHASRTFALEWMYNKVTGRPTDPNRDTVLGLLAYRTDPGEAAYYYMRERLNRWQDLNGLARGAGDPTDRSNALYYWRKAAQWGDDKTAQRWLREYLRLGGTGNGLLQSLRVGAPTGSLSAENRARFLHGLNQEERDMLAEATQWYRQNWSTALKQLGQMQGGVR